MEVTCDAGIIGTSALVRVMSGCSCGPNVIDPHHSRHGLLVMVGRRKRLLEYLKNKNFEGYSLLIKKLGIRK